MTEELKAQNEATIARMAARREVRRLRKNKKKVPPELLAAAQFNTEEPKAPKTPTCAPKREKHEESCKCGVCGPVTRKDYVAALKAKYPDIKGLADATTAEIVTLLQANAGDSVFAELQEKWSKRAKARHDAWLEGDSASAKKARAKLAAKK